MTALAAADDAKNDLRLRLEEKFAELEVSEILMMC
jgi:hypothetical protein